MRKAREQELDLARSAWLASAGGPKGEDAKRHGSEGASNERIKFRCS